MLRFSQIIAFFLLASFFATSAFAEHDRVITEQQAREMELHLRVHTVMLRLEMEFEQAENAGQLNKSAVIEKLKDATGRIIGAYTTPQNKTILERLKPQVLAKVAWDKLYEHVVGAAKMVRDVHRRSGLAPAMLAATGLAADLTVPPALLAANAPIAAGVTGAVPWVAAMPWAYNRVSSALEQRRIRRAYEPRRWREVTEAASTAAEALRLSDAAAEVLAPLYSDEGFRRSIPVANRGVIRRFLEWIGVMPQSITYERLRAVVRQYRPGDRFTSMLDRDHHTDKVIKAAMLAAYLEYDPNPNIRELFARNFSHRIQTMPARVDITVLEGWAMEAANAENFEELKQWLDLVPEGSNVRWVVRLWREVIIPHLQKGPLVRQDARRLREMLRNSEALLVEADHAPDTVWSNGWMRKFVATVGEPSPVNFCRRNMKALVSGQILF